jgi:hypothetical protein
VARRGAIKKHLLLARGPPGEEREETRRRRYPSDWFLEKRGRDVIEEG